MPVREMLPLIPVFDAILSEGSLSRAGERLGVTQSAVSQALTRMRKLANDELFESTGRGVRPTPRALEMATHLRAALLNTSTALAPTTIDAATLERTFVLDIGAGFDALVLPPLVNELSQHAPKVRLVVSNMRGSDLLAELKYGDTELAFDFQVTDAEGIRSQLIGSGAAVVIARPGHPALKKGLTKQLYNQLPQVALVWARSPAPSGVAVGQARLGLTPNITVSVPTIMTQGAIVASTDLIATTSGVVGTLLAECYRLQTLPLPFRFPHLAIYQLWHERFDADAGHRWLRETIKLLGAQEIKQRASPNSPASRLSGLRWVTKRDRSCFNPGKVPR